MHERVIDGTGRTACSDKGPGGGAAADRTYRHLVKSCEYLSMRLSGPHLTRVSVRVRVLPSALGSITFGA